MRRLRTSLVRRLRDESGQNIVLAALVLLFVFLAVMLTFSIGYRTREKIKLQALADSGAWSIAVAEARTFNFFAFTNRVNAAHNVAVLSVHSHVSYISWQEALFYGLANVYKQIAGKFIPGFNFCPPSKPVPCCKSGTDKSKVNEVANWVESGAPFSAEKFHKQWHQSHSDDKALAAAADRHHDGAKAMKAAQQKMLDDLKDKLMKNQAMAVAAAQVVDKDIVELEGAADCTTGNLDKAIRQGPSDDWKEITSGTRFPTFLHNRHFLGGMTWDALRFGAVAELGKKQCIGAPASASEAGNAKHLKDSHTSYGSLHGAMHNGAHGAAGWAGSKGFGAEDHGDVSSPPVVCTTAPEPICVSAGGGQDSPKGGVYSEPDSPTHMYFHGSSEQAASESTHKMGGDADGDGVKGIYVQHYRYVWGDPTRPDDKLWNHPHVVTALSKKMDLSSKQVFDFNVQLGLPVPVHYQTAGNAGDTKADSKMVAVAGALVYYHNPGSESWQEPPSFWNPFWRAKLHPITSADAQGALSKSSPFNDVASGNPLKYINY